MGAKPYELTEADKDHLDEYYEGMRQRVVQRMAQSDRVSVVPKEWVLNGFTGPDKGDANSVLIEMLRRGEIDIAGGSGNAGVTIVVGKYGTPWVGHYSFTRWVKMTQYGPV